MRLAYNETSSYSVGLIINLNSVADQNTLQQLNNLTLLLTPEVYVAINNAVESE